MNSSSIRMARFQQRTFWFSLILSLFTKWLDWSSDENQKNGIMSKCTRSTNSPKLTWKGDIRRKNLVKTTTHISVMHPFLPYFRTNNCIGQRKNQSQTHDENSTKTWLIYSKINYGFKMKLFAGQTVCNPPILVKLHSNYFLIKFNY